MSTTVIVGAGVIGLTAAFELHRRGEHVIVVDMGEPGAACSLGNAGWVTPSLAGPLPGPDVTWTSVKWILSRDSPLYIRPRLDWPFTKWLWTFWRHCNEHDYLRGFRAVAALGQITLGLYDRLSADGVEFEMHSSGLLHVFLDAHHMEHVLRDLSLMSKFGYPSPTVLSTQDVRAAEPSLSPEVVGGILVNLDRHVRPETLTKALVKRLTEAKVDIRPRTEVTGVAWKGRAVRAVETTAGAISADQVLVAAGAWSKPVASVLGADLPIEAGKGYSVTITEPHLRLSRPLYLAEARLGVSPFQGALRVAGTMELTGLNLRLDPRRVVSIRRSATRYIPGWDAGARQTEWVGMRPLTPDGVPMIGRLPHTDNVFVATGHSMLGVTLAPSTAVCIAELMCRGSGPVDLTPFEPGRFTRSR